VVEVPDLRLAQLSEIVQPERVVPAIVEFVDIAGLVAGASTGEGLGNKFLAHIRETDATINVVRCFEDDNVIHVAGRVDPIADIEVIQTELCLADLSAVEKALHRVTKTARSGDKESIKLVDPRKVPSCAQRSQAGAHPGFQQRRVAAAQAVLLNYRQTRHVCSQCGRRWL